MRISDWSSDVCSSDLSQPIGAGGHGVGSAYRRRTGRCRRFAIYRSRHPGLGSRDRDSQRHLPGGKKRKQNSALHPTEFRNEFAEYFHEEVLDLEQKEVRDFIVDTSILTELTPSACAAVARSDDARAALDEIGRAHD